MLGAADAGTGAEMKVTILWAMVILAFGVLMMVCVLLLLKREPGELAQWEPGSSAVKSSGYLQHLSRLLRAIRAINSVIISDRQVEQMLQKACRTLTETRGYKMAWIGSFALPTFILIARKPLARLPSVCLSSASNENCRSIPPA